LRNAFLYTDDYFAYDYGASHPLKIERLRLTHDLCRAYGLLDLPDADRIESSPAPESEILRFHTADYVEALKRASRGEAEWDFAHGLGPGDNPVFPGLWEWSLLHAGASLQGAQQISQGKARIAFNIAGGLHHAGADRASGFCYVNDPVLAILHFAYQGKKVLYLDIDAHHGDGVQWAFYEDPRVLTVSFHQDGRTLFPGTGGLAETGRGEGTGYAVNVPMLPGTDDHVFWTGFESVVPRLMQAFRPDVVVAQLGVDSLVDDPLAALELTTHGFGRAIAYLTEAAPALLALGGGGYNPGNVARAWTLAWATMNRLEPADELPEEMRAPLRAQGASGTRLHDEEHASRVREPCLEQMRRCVGYLEEHVFPKIL
jgi:acetoin utilization protein AcuC